MLSMYLQYHPQIQFCFLDIDQSHPIQMQTPQMSEAQCCHEAQIWLIPHLFKNLPIDLCKQNKCDQVKLHGHVVSDEMHDDTDLPLVSHLLM